MSSGGTIDYYDADQVQQLLSWPMVTEAIKAAFIATSNAEKDSKKPDKVANNQEQDKDAKKDKTKSSYACQPTRSITECGGNNMQLLLTMPAYVGNYRLEHSSKTFNTLACKVVTSFPENSNKDPPIPNILAHVLLFNTENGQLESVVEATQITAWRTAGASIVATKYLLLNRENEGTDIDSMKPINVAIVGCGVQGRNHALGLCDTYRVGKISLWNRTESHAQDLEAAIKTEYPEVNVTVSPDPAAAVADADVICVATFSSEPLIKKSMIKKEAVHINAVGAGQVHFGEVAQDIYEVAAVYIDSWANAKQELQGLKAKIVGEVGDVITSDKRLPKNGITIFQSMGMAAEDATVTHAVINAIKITNKKR